MSLRRSPVGFGWLALILLITPAPLPAQGGAPLGSARHGIIERAAVDTMLADVTERPPAAIQRDLDAAVSVERSKSMWERQLDADADALASALDEQIAEIERAQEGLRVADELDADSRRDALREELRLRELLRDITVERIRIVNLERAVLERRLQHARAWRKQLELESELAADRAVWRALHGEDAVVSGAAERRRELAGTIDDRLKGYFEAHRDALRERERLAVAERGVAEARLGLLALRRELLDD